MKAVESKAEIYLMALQSLSKAEREAVISRLLEDPTLREDFLDLITIQKKPDGTVVEGASEGVFGGAVTTIESILLRVMVILRRGLRPLLILDESLPALREPYLSNTGKFLSLLCARVGLDILLVLSDQTGSLVGTADKAYKLVVKDGAATFEGIR